MFVSNFTLLLHLTALVYNCQVDLISELPDTKVNSILAVNEWACFHVDTLLKVNENLFRQTRQFPFGEWRWEWIHGQTEKKVKWNLDTHLKFVEGLKERERERDGFLFQFFNNADVV